MPAPNSLRVLLIGAGGREHALAWSLSSSPLVHSIFCIPGNGGTSSLPKTTNISSVSAADFGALVAFARDSNVDIVIPGPEDPLVAGITDYFEQHTRGTGMWVFGPSRAAARMEGSKVFSKDFMKRHGIPTAAFESFSDYDSARKYLDSVHHEVVIKASGLAAGKGVIIPASREEAHAELANMMLKNKFGTAGSEVVIEELLEGEEISILSFCDGMTIKSLPPAQDHKRIRDGDEGPNTGGMGTYAPAMVASEDLLREIDRTVLQKTVDAMKEEGYPMVGCLFTGFMLTTKGPKVLEYNVRFGDPETQSLLRLMESDLAEVILACAKQRLDRFDLKISSQSAATVVVASGGYPESYKKDIPIELTEVPEDVVLFHAGTKMNGETLETDGGRVIAASATGITLQEAVDKAYRGVKCIHFDGMQYRSDIAHRALK